MDDQFNEVVHHRLLMIAEEGGIRAARSAGSTFVSQGGGIASALFTRDGRIVSQTAGGQMHVSGIRYMLHGVLEAFPIEIIREGDVFLSNDQFRGGIHPTDLACFTPIFHDGRLLYFAGMMMVVSDMGGTSPGSLPANASEVFHEGVVIPPAKLYRAGELNETLLDIMFANSRVPAKLRTDVEALAGAGAIVAARMIELIGKYGADELESVVQVLMDHTEKLVRLGIKAIPDGEYHGSYHAENDGVGPEESYEVKVRIEVTGSDILFDFTGSAEQARGAINSSLSQSMSFTAYALRCYLDPHLSMNEGFYRPVRCIFPEGSVLNPRFPAACNLRFSVGQALVDAVNRALMPLFPERAVASSGGIASVNAAGVEAGVERMWSAFDVLFGAGGGRAHGDANDGLPFPMLNQGGYMRNVEAYEIQYPLIFHSYRLDPDTAGPGRFRGGAGLVKEIEFLEDSTITLRATDRTLIMPQGAGGGHEGRGGGWIVNRGKPDERRVPPKTTNYLVKAGDILSAMVAGGGGLGDPLLRAPELVRQDVAGGVVSVEGAAADYGVVLDAATLALDEKRTARLRRTMAGEMCDAE